MMKLQQNVQNYIFSYKVVAKLFCIKQNVVGRLYNYQTVKSTVEPCYNERPKTMTITLLYQGTKNKEI